MGKLTAVRHLPREVHCRIAISLTLALEVSSFALNGKTLSYPCLGVAVLKTEVARSGEAGFAKDCTVQYHNCTQTFFLRTDHYTVSFL